MIPSCVSLSVTISNMSDPSPLEMVYSVSAFSPTSGSFALILPRRVPGGADSGELN